MLIIDFNEVLYDLCFFVIIGLIRLVYRLFYKIFDYKNKIYIFDIKYF